MADKSAIEWTDATWNPIRARNLRTGKVGWHCEHATTGCEFCYAEGFNKRLGTGLPFKPGHRKDIELFLDDKMLTQPLRWKKPRMIFVCSMTDLFADFVPDEWIDRMFAVMALSPQHTFQVLTKRPERMREYFSGSPIEICRRVADASTGRGGCFTADDLWTMWPLPNVWLGVSAERQQEADDRILWLLETPAAVRFISAEPLLGPLDLTMVQRRHWARTQHMNVLTGKANPSLEGVAPKATLDWVIVGGESGRGARPMHPDWPRSLREQCAAADVAFFFKQFGEYAPSSEQEWADDDGSHHHLLVAPDGRYGDTVADLLTMPKGAAWLRRVGKAKAGRLLDGLEHNGMPGS
jgi:protein gp37